MSDFLEVHCPSCGRNQIFSTAGVAKEGAWGHCAGCGEEIFVTPDGSEVSHGQRLVAREAAQTEATAVATAPAAVATLAPEHERAFLRMATGKVEELSLDAIQHGVQAGHITPWDLVSDDGDEFEAISHHHTMRDYFFDRAFGVRLQPRCHQHREQLPAGTCHRCGRSYCSDCVASLNLTSEGRCGACNGALKPPDPRLIESPPWKRLSQVALFPIEGGAWIITVALAAILWIAGRSIIASPLLVIGLGLVMFALDRASRGDRILRLTPGVDVGGLARLVLPALVVSLALAAPFVFIQRFLASGLGTLLLFVLGIAAFAYYPMALGRLLLTVDKQKALQPRGVIAAILALREEYLLCLTLLLLGGVAAFGVQTLVGLIPGIGPLLEGLARAYGLILISYLLGWNIYMNRERIVAAG